jgi:superfamily II DNA or RNA helicase
MLQSVYPKEFPADFFKDYGFTIFDECHKLGAQQFSRCLAKIQTRHMLGLSATPDRDDGLAKVFEWYIGRPVYQERIREPDPTVQVKAVWFRSDDDAYTEVPTDWKGEVVTARLLTKLVEFQPRTERILQIIREAITDSRRQILVLSERKAHLEAFEQGLAQENIQSPWKTRTGYYVGGMKQEELDRNSKDAQVLLATYAMASEALNIKSLNAVVLASPRKKIEQSTGRILRLRPDQRVIEPVIYDIIDSHDTYVRQWWTRQRYYKQCSYSIQHIGRARTDTSAVAVETEQNVCVCMIHV